MRRLLLAAAALGALAFLAWNVGRHGFLCDDAFISFRYVRNLVDGHGLVFNRGRARSDSCKDFVTRASVTGVAFRFHADSNA